MSHIDLALVQPDWTRFMSPGGLAEKSGTRRDNFPRMILKELADNAADAGGAWLSVPDPDVVVIGDEGPGIEGEIKLDSLPGVHSKIIHRKAVLAELWQGFDLTDRQAFPDKAV